MKQTSGNPWVERWDVPGNNGKTWTVGRRKDGSFGCSCPAWKFAKAPKPDCHHIAGIKLGGPPTKTAPRVVFANVREVTPKPETNEVYTPLMPIGDIHFALTIAYDLARAGVATGYIRDHYLFRNSLKTATAFIEGRGRKIYGPWKKGIGHSGFVIKDVVPHNETP